MFYCLYLNNNKSFLLQTISLLVYMSGGLGKNGPFLVLSPLSVMENWRSELERYNSVPYA